MKIAERASLVIFSFFLLCNSSLAQRASYKIGYYEPDHPYIQYMGRVDFSDPKLPRFWQPGVSVTVRVKGHRCDFIVNDEELWGKNHNYLELVVDGEATRLQTKAKRDTISVAGLSEGTHTITLVKNTEANIGWLELVGIKCHELLAPDPKPKRKIEFIGNSITCGTGSDQTVVPCGKGVWQDQHNAYLSYGAITARKLKAQYHLSAVSGIGLMRSCCNMEVIMPQVFDKISMRNNAVPWNVEKYQPDVLTVCLGQNDGIQDSAAFCDSYIAFIKKLREYYPKADIICLTSPMADASLAAFMKKTLTVVIEKVNRSGDKKVSNYFFSRQYSSGCDYHPGLEEHKQIADELTAFIRKKMKW
ncbi:MAG: hypothetical protein JNN00_07780 [Chitinophagaceae bacterium]|nr:hypothetical protein [Chitinophagaceae bacterium]